MNLRRAANGKLRPDMAEPTTAAQAKTYSEAMKTANQANRLLDHFTQRTTDLGKADNSEKDLNSTEGVVVTFGPFNGADLRDKLQESQVLNFDPSSSQAQTYESTIEGTAYRSTSKVSSTAGRNYAVRESASYTSGPLVDLRSETLMSIPDDSSRFSKTTTTLRETSSGVLVYETNEEEQNLYEK